MNAPPRLLGVAAFASVVFLACGQPLPSELGPASLVPGPVTSPPASSPPATPSPSPSPPSVAWTEIALDPATFAGAWVGTVIAGGPGIVAFGRAGMDGPPVTWTSVDGETWARHDQAASTFGGAVPRLAVQGPAGVIAVGGQPSPDGLAPEVWLSADGAAWRRDPSASGRFGPRDELAGLVASPSAVVAFGSDGYDSYVLRSSEGERWTRLEDEDLALGRNASFRSVAGTGDGFLAFGTLRAGMSGASWTSTDGWTWERRDWPAETWSGGSVFALRDGYMAVGSKTIEGNSVDAAMWSPDGRSWDSSPYPTVAGIDDADSVPNLAEVVSPAAWDLGIFADWRQEAGYRELLAIADQAGQRWLLVEAPAPGLDERWAGRVVAVGDRVLAFDNELAGDRARAWWGELARPAAAAATETAPALPGPTAPSSATPDPTLTPVPVPDGADLAWQRLLGRGAVLGTAAQPLRLAAVEAFRGGWVALGDDGDGIATFWSPDGLRWERTSAPGALGLGRIDAAAAHGGIVVAVGTHDDPDDESEGPPGGIVLRSTDGRHWERSVDASLGRSALRDVTATSGGFVAVGSIEPDLDHVRPMAWTSQDGRRWTRAASVEEDRPAGSDSPVYSRLTSVAAGPSGFVAGGDGVGTALVWTSRDARSWRIVPDRSAFAVPTADWYYQGSIADVAAVGSGFVAVGDRAQPGDMVESEGAVFVSADGVAWEALPRDEQVAATSLTTVVPFAGGLVMAGRQRSSTGGRAVAWTSSDGRTWREVDPVSLGGPDPHPPHFTEIDDLAPRGDGLVAVGSAGSERWNGTTSGAIWLAGPHGVPLPEVTCPVRSPSITTVLAMSATDRVACFGRRVQSIRAYVAPPIGDGERPVPWMLLSGPGRYGQHGNSIGIDLRLPAGSRPVEGWATVTGHFADSACDAAEPDDRYEPPTLARLACQATFVVTRLRPAK